MKLFYTLFLIPLVLIGCCRSSEEVWDDTRTCGRYVGKGFSSLGGKHGDSRQVRCRDDFNSSPECYDSCSFDSYGFVPLQDEEGDYLIAMNTIEQSPYAPGEPESHVPGVESFFDPADNSDTANVFQNITFPYNSDLIKGEKNLQTAEKIANYLNRHPEVHLFIEGHCDERGAEAYNLALGSRRANSVRNFLIQNGVPADKLYTISYGKERPIASGHNESAWSTNRRGQFKLWRSR